MYSNTLTKMPKSIFQFILLSVIFSFVFAGNLFASQDMQPTVFTDSMDPVPANGEFDYELTLTNNGDDDAYNTELNVSIPNGFTYLNNSLDSECSLSGASPSTGDTNVTCNFGTFPGNLSKFLTITLKAGSTTGVFQSDASIYCDGDANTANDTELVKTTIKISSDLNLTKTSLTNPIAAGGMETYEFVVGNKGPYKATEITVTDTLPSGLSFRDNTTGSGWSCSASGQDVTCTYSNELDINASSTFTFDAKVTTDTVGTLSNVAIVSAKEMEVNSDDNNGTDDLTVTAGTDVSISKSIVERPAIAEQGVTFKLVVKNEGPMVAEDVMLTDTLPSGYTGISASGTGWSCSVSGQEVSCTRNDTSMDVDLSETITITATAPSVSGAADNHSNTADVNTTTDDPILSNDSHTISYLLWADQADLEVHKSKSPDPVAVGSEATSSIYVHNNGPRAATPVQIVDVLDENESFIEYNGTDWDCTFDSGTHAVTCDYNTSVNALANGDNTATLTIITLADVEDSNLSNTVCTGGSGGSDEPDALDKHEENDCVGVGIRATGHDDYNITDIKITKTTSDSVIEVDEDSFTYTMIVENIGKDTGEHVLFKDIIPQYIGEHGTRPATGISFTTSVGACTHNTGTISCDFGDMDVNDSVEVNVTVTRPMRDGNRTNTAQAYSELTGDTNRTNNEDSVNVTVKEISDIELVEKLVTYVGKPDPILAGTEATYTIQIRNNGPSIAKDVNVSDVFDGESYTLISYDTSKGTCAYDDENRTLNCALGDMAYTNTETITVVIRPDHNATVTDDWEITNIATVETSSVESNITNNDKNQTLSVNLGEVDISIEINEAPSFQEPVPFDPDNNDSNVIVYEVIVQNLGPSLATDINFSVHVNKVSPDNDQNLTFLRDTSE